MSNLLQQTLELVQIPSQTGFEEAICNYLEQWCKNELPGVPFVRQRNSLMVYPPQIEGRLTIGLIGHIDTVPSDPNQPLEIQKNRLYGCGSSDMKGGIALMMEATKEWEKLPCNLVGVFYDREEGPDQDNGMRSLIDKLPPMDFALVLEPTNNCIEAGCMGGVHATVTFEGKRAHSAHPWQGQNAIYRALPVLAKLRDRPRQEVTVDGLTFYEVITATMAHTENAANVVPDKFIVNVNMRFAPGHTDITAVNELTNIVGDLASIEIRDVCEAGKVCISNPLIQKWIDKCGLSVEPKQAWTDLARLTAKGIDAVNFGPGDPSRAHQAVEWIEEEALEKGRELLFTFLNDICDNGSEANS